MSKWKRTTLGEVISESNGLIQTGPFGSQLHASDYVENGIPCIMPTNMKENRVSLTGIARISDKDAQRLSQHLVKSGDIVYSRRCDITQKALISDAENGFFCGTGCILIRPGGNVDSRFLTYFLSTKESKEWLINHAVGITMPNLNTKILFKLPLRLPSRDHQERIAAVLSSIDQKIEINNRINAELEAMAKTLYDYWFVQFDFPFDFAQGAPDENGKPYKSSGGKMVYSKELKREIPAGWEVKELHQIANITMGQSPEGSSYNEAGKGIVFFQGSTDFGMRFPNIRQYTTEPSRLAKAGDILLSVRAPVGTMNIADIDCCIGRGLAALNSKDGFDAYLFYVMEYFKRLFDRRNSEGTTFGSITKNDLFSLQVAYPDKLLLKAYDDVIAENNKLVLNNQKENQQLTALRDWLLPMLMNGQVQVTDTNHLKTAETQHSADNSPA